MMTGARPGDSKVQREAEALILRALGDELGVQLAPRRFYMPSGERLEVDGVCDEPPILVEAWAHHGPPKAAQKFKVTNDAFKLLAARRLMNGQPRLILCFADAEAARPFQVRSWRAIALAEAGIEVRVVTLADELRAAIRAAQVDQYR